MKSSSLLVLLAASFLTNHTLAGTIGPVGDQPNWGSVVSLSAGPVWERAGTNQTFNLTPTIEKAYIADKTTHAIFDGEIFLGMHHTWTQALSMQFGVAANFSSDVHLAGVIWDDADPEFDNFTYNYTIRHTHIALKSKLFAEYGYWLTPWVSGSIGVGFNNAHSFQNTPTIFEALPTPNFISHSKTSFTYTVGAGVQKALNANWQVGVGYEFADWGKSRLGKAVNQTLNQGLTLHHLYTHGVLFSLTYST